MIVAVRTTRGISQVAASRVEVIPADEAGAFLEFVDGRTGDVVATVYLRWVDLRRLCRSGQSAHE